MKIKSILNNSIKSLNISRREISTIQQSSKNQKNENPKKKYSKSAIYSRNIPRYKTYRIKNRLEFKNLLSLNVQNKKINMTFQYLNKDDVISPIINLSTKIQHYINMKNQIATEKDTNVFIRNSESKILNEHIKKIMPIRYFNKIDFVSILQSNLNGSIGSINYLKFLTSITNYMIYQVRELQGIDSKQNNSSIIEIEKKLWKMFTLLVSKTELKKEIFLENRENNENLMINFYLILEFILYLKFKYISITEKIRTGNELNNTNPLQIQNINKVVGKLSKDWNFSQSILFYYMLLIIDKSNYNKDHMLKEIEKNITSIQNNLVFECEVENFNKIKDILFTEYLITFFNFKSLQKHVPEKNYYTTLFTSILNNDNLKKVIDYHNMVGKISIFKFDKNYSLDLINLYCIEILFNNVVYDKFEKINSHPDITNNSLEYKKCLLYTNNISQLRKTSGKYALLLEKSKNFEIKNSFDLISDFNSHYQENKELKYTDGWNLLKYQLNFCLLLSHAPMMHLNFDSLINQLQNKIQQLYTINYESLQEDLPIRQALMSLDYLKKFCHFTKLTYSSFSNYNSYLMVSLLQHPSSNNSEAKSKMSTVMKKKKNIYPLKIKISSISPYITIENKEYSQTVYSFKSKQQEYIKLLLENNLRKENKINNNFPYIPFFVIERNNIFKSNNNLDFHISRFISKSNLIKYEKNGKLRKKSVKNSISIINDNSIEENRNMLTEQLRYSNSVTACNALDNYQIIRQILKNVNLDYIVKNRMILFRLSRYNIFKYSTDIFNINLQQILFKHTKIKLSNNGFLDFFVILSLSKILKKNNLSHTNFLDFYREYINDSIRKPREMPTRSKRIIKSLSRNMIEIPKKLTNRKFYAQRILENYIDKHLVYKYIIKSEKKSDQFLVSFLYALKSSNIQISLKKHTKNKLIYSIYSYMKSRDKKANISAIKSLIHSLHLSEEETRYILGGVTNKSTKAIDKSKLSISRMQSYNSNQ
mmetsp:Transcript_10753/g.26311  ORF Transcript_10753/g.26311 Transcript_10753/m.26311 type:complete len:990 (+) Transcript_10753:752-3721(+)